MTRTPENRNPAARAAAGRAARKLAPLTAHAGWSAGGDRADPVALLTAEEADRLPELLPIRHARMAASPLAFLRGSAGVMAADLAAAPHSGLITQLCGDAHLFNFGLYASPERRLVFDLNDFDETFPGPFEWDVKRLVTSIAMAGRANGFRRRDRATAVRYAARRYREAMIDFAAMRELDLWYAHADVDELHDQFGDQLGKSRLARLTKAGAKARTRTSLQAYRKLTAVVDGERRIVADPPLLVPVQDLVPDLARKQLESQIRILLDGYRDSLAEDRRRLFDAFEFVDLARKVVGVGSVGTRCWIVLLTGRDDEDPLLLQVKEAGRSVLDPGDAPPDQPQGRRVVTGQRLMQAASDIFLGWHTVEGFDGKTRDFYVRQLRDWKGGAVVEEMDATGMRVYGGLCAWTLARAHARCGDRIAIAAYLGSSPKFDEALAEFAELYADRAERDHAAFAGAVERGELESRPDIRTLRGCQPGIGSAGASVRRASSVTPASNTTSRITITNSPVHDDQISAASTATIAPPIRIGSRLRAANPGPCVVTARPPAATPCQAATAPRRVCPRNQRGNRPGPARYPISASSTPITISWTPRSRSTLKTVVTVASTPSR